MTKGKKIAMILDQDFPPDVRVEKEIHSLMDAGFDVNLISLSFRNRIKNETFEGISIHRIFGNKLLYKLSALAFTLPIYHFVIYHKLRGLIQVLHPNFLHVHDMVIAPAVLKLSKKNNIPIVLDLHENRPAIMQLYAHVNQFPGKYLINLGSWKNAQHKLQQESDRIILVTNEAKSYAATHEGINPDKIFVVENTVGQDFKNKLNSSEEIANRFENKFCVLYFGDTACRRGTDTLIKSVAILKSEIKNIHVILVGKSNEDNKLRKLADSLKVSNRVSFEGWQNEKLLKAYAEASSVGICPFKRNLHHDTTYANKLFQFMGLGLPVIVSNCPAQARLVEKHKSGLVFEAGNEVDLAKMILNLYCDDKLRHQFSINGINAIQNELNWEKSAKSLIEVYKSLNS